jgi:hypothetical protein
MTIYKNLQRETEEKARQPETKLGAIAKTHHTAKQYDHLYCYDFISWLGSFASLVVVFIPPVPLWRRMFSQLCALALVILCAACT